MERKKHKLYELYIGRFSIVPPHEGHLGIINTLLKEDKMVCIAIRDTKISDKDPYTYEERHRAFQKIYYKEIAEGNVKIIKIPDIENAVFGRKPGWGIRQVRLSPEIEAISGTQLRKKQREK